MTMLPSSGPVRLPMLSIVLAALLALSVSGYSLAGLATAVLGLQSTVLSIPFRLLVIGLSGFLLLEVVRTHWRFRVDAFLLLFWWAYTIRLIFDLSTGQFPDSGDALTFFFATVVIPSLVVMAAARGYDEGGTARLLFLIGVVVGGGSIFLSLTGRVNQELIVSQEGRLTFDTLNTISLGHVGATTAIAALALWRRPGLPGGRLTILIGAGIALTSLILAGSRGPLLALVVALMAYSVIQGRWGQIAALGLGLMFMIPSLVAARGLTILTRFESLYGDVSALGRLEFQANAIDQGWAHPLFGSAYVELTSGNYPHNLIVESFMALGMAGAVLFIFLCARSAMQAAKRLRAGEVLLPLLLFQYLTGAQFSGSLWGTSALWVAMALLVSQTSEEASMARRQDRRLSGQVA